MKAAFAFSQQYGSLLAATERPNGITICSRAIKDISGFSVLEKQNVPSLITSAPLLLNPKEPALFALSLLDAATVADFNNSQLKNLCCNPRSLRMLGTISLLPPCQSQRFLVRMHQLFH